MNIIITGASKGIGKAIALAFSHEKHHFFLLSRHEPALQSLRCEIIANHRDSAVDIFPIDCSQKENISNIASQILTLKNDDQHDILLNNVGVFKPSKITEEEDGFLDHMMAINLYSAYYFTKHMLPSMMKKRGGYIFNMCSIASLQAYTNGGAYSISKYALLGFSNNLREELKPYNIKVTAICPGATWTNSWKDSGVPQQRLMQAEDIAKMVYQTTQLSDSAVVEHIVLLLSMAICYNNHSSVRNGLTYKEVF